MNAVDGGSMEEALHEPSINSPSRVHLQSACGGSTPTIVVADHQQGFTMTRLTHGLMLALMTVSPIATAARAQETHETGVYAVARVGGSIAPKQKLDFDDLSASFPNDAKYKAALTGQVGAGYDFGRFRVEQTIGYTDNELNSKDFRTDGFTGEGRSRSLAMTIAGYVDIPITDRIVPYVGGGVGAARVETRLSSTNAATGDTSSFSGKDWGLLWHADAGVGVRMSPKTTLEFGARYSQTSRLKYDGVNEAINTSYEPKLSNVSGTVGVRYAF
jgi:opacity protein-like surface antigen